MEKDSNNKRKVEDEEEVVNALSTPEMNSNYDTLNVAKIFHSMRAIRSFKVNTAPTQIKEGLYLGCVIAANKKDELKRLNITHVLTVATALQPLHPNDFKYKVIEVHDTEITDLTQHFDDAANFIDEAKSVGGSVLVHCYAGISRSVTIVVAYLMRKHGMSFTHALEHVKSKRPQASPNSGFLLQLQNFGKTLKVDEKEQKKEFANALARFDELRAKLLRSIRAKRCLRVNIVPDQIEEGLYLGCVIAAHNKDGLKRLNVTHVLTVATSLDPQHPNDFKYKVIEVHDRHTTDLSQHFDDTANFIDEAKSAGGSVLVHCYAGRSRSVTIVVAYLMRKHGMSFTKALEHVKSKRPQASPNYGFLLQLQKFGKTLEACYPTRIDLVGDE